MQKTASLTQFKPSAMYCWKLPPFLSSDSSLGSILPVKRGGLKQCLNGPENDPAYTRLHLKSSHNVSSSKLPVLKAGNLEWLSSADDQEVQSGTQSWLGREDGWVKHCSWATQRLPFTHRQWKCFAP